MKLYSHLNNRANKIEMCIGFILTIIGIIWLFERHYTESAYLESLRFADVTRIAYLSTHNTFNITHGLWTIPLCLGIVLFIDSLEMIPDIEIRKSIKKYWRWKIKN